MPKRIALFFDGTWNTPHDDSDRGTGNTNVRQLYNAWCCPLVQTAYRR